MENKTPAVITLVIMVAILLAAAGGLLVAYTGQSDRVQVLERQQREASEELKDAEELIVLLEERVGEVEDDSRVRALPYRENTRTAIVDGDYSTDLYSSTDGFVDAPFCDPDEKTTRDGNIFVANDDFKVEDLAEYLPADLTPDEIDFLNAQFATYDSVGICPFDERTLFISDMGDAAAYRVQFNEGNMLATITDSVSNFFAESYFIELDDRIGYVVDQENGSWTYRYIDFSIREMEIGEDCSVLAEDEELFCRREYIGAN